MRHYVKESCIHSLKRRIAQSEIGHFRIMKKVLTSGFFIMMLAKHQHIDFFIRPQFLVIISEGRQIFYFQPRFNCNFMTIFFF